MEERKTTKTSKVSVSPAKKQVTLSQPESRVVMKTKVQTGTGWKRSLRKQRRGVESAS